jgi:hypothetical protein
MTSDGYAQQYGSGLCGMTAILNGLRVLFGEDAITEKIAGHLQVAMARALVGTGATDLPGVLFEDGTGRDQLKRMLRAARAWTDEAGWLPWRWDGVHPIKGTTASRFWMELSLAMQGRRATLVVGFGSDTLRGTDYEPHWTCVEAIGAANLDLRDGAGYGYVPISDTGVRPEPRWAVQDAFLLSQGS